MRERVIVVGVGLKSRPGEMASSLSELRGLVDTAGGEVVAEFAQTVARFHPATLIGKGKLEEVAAAVASEKAGTVVVDHELAPAQQKSLEGACRAKIIDRTRLILDIFAKRARTSEGRLQVELAQLSYMLPRLTGAWRAFSQQAGGIGTRGPGERKLEYERRHIQYRIEHLRRDLERVRSARLLRRQPRLSVPVPQVALIGYTNVGKSTLLNTLTRGAAGVYADDKLFATLDPTARRVRLPEGSWAVMTDTVGFIRRLPTTLVAAFRSTLEEATLADCLLLVGDASSAEAESQHRAVEGILAELKADDIPRVRVFNKVDLLEPKEREDLRRSHPGAAFISAATGEGIDEALRRIQEVISERWILREADVSPAAENDIRGCAQVLSRVPLGDKMRYRLRLTPENWARLQKRLGPGVA